MHNSPEKMPDQSEMVRMLSGADLRSTGQSDALVKRIRDSTAFALLARLIHHPERLVAMRAADAIEKLSARHPEWLQSEKNSLLDLLKKDCPIEIRWHLALMVPRLTLEPDEVSFVTNQLFEWLRDKTGSRLVRVGSLQGLYEFYKTGRLNGTALREISTDLIRENIPSLNARIRKLGIITDQTL